MRLAVHLEIEGHESADRLGKEPLTKEISM